MKDIILLILIYYGVYFHKFYFNIYIESFNIFIEYNYRHYYLNNPNNNFVCIYIY